MKVSLIYGFGDEDVLRYEEIPDPVPGIEDVLIHVHSASVNRGDLGRRSGTHPVEHFPHIIGWEIAGVVERVGVNVSEFKEGDRVVAILNNGGYAEKVVASQNRLVKIPETLSFDEASAVPIVFLTGWYALIIAKIHEHEYVLVNAAGSGTGIAAIEVAKYFGGRVIASAGTPEKLAFARELGVEFCIDYTRHDLAQEVMAITEGKGANVVFETVGGKVFEKSLGSMAIDGRMAIVGNSSSKPGLVNPHLILRRCLTLYGFHLFRWLETSDSLEILSKILEMVSRGVFCSRVDKRFPLKEAAQAHRYIANRRNIGKVILNPP